MFFPGGQFIFPYIRLSCDPEGATILLPQTNAFNSRRDPREHLPSHLRPVRQLRRPAYHRKRKIRGSEQNHIIDSWEGCDAQSAQVCQVRGCSIILKLQFIPIQSEFRTRTSSLQVHETTSSS